jgi:hypothetical protein
VVERELGKGGMGAVLVVRHETLGVRYALKVLARGTLRSEEADRFQREIEALAALSGHPHIVAVHASGIEAGRPWYVMDLLEAESLDALTKKGLLSIPAALRMAVHVARGLEAAHARGIVHRDVKPGNVLVLDDLDKDGRAVLCDFGVALAPGERLTETGTTLGTPAFMAPEQAMGDRARMGPPTDVFSLAAVVYYALTGELPYEHSSTTPMALMRALMAGKLRSPRQFRPDIPEALERLLLRCLERDPTRRPPTGAALRRELEALVAGKDLPASVRSRAWVVGALGALVLVGAGLALVARGPAPAAPAPPPVRVGGSSLASVTSHAAVSGQPNVRLADALVAGDPKQVKAAIGDRRALLSPGEGQLAAKLLVDSDPIFAVECLLGDRIPEQEGERRELEDFVESAVRGRDDDRVLAGVAAAAVSAGLDLGSLRERVRNSRDMRFGNSQNDELTKRLHFVLIASGRRSDSDPTTNASQRLERKELDPHEWASIGDWNANLGTRSSAPEADELVAYARSSARAGDLPRAERFLADARGRPPGNLDPEQLELAQREVEDPRTALDKLGPPEKDGTARKLSRASIEARAPGDEHAFRSEALWIEIIRENRGKHAKYWLLVHAYESLVKLELERLKKPLRALAWFARGRIELEGGGPAFDALAERLFPDQKK